MPQIAVTVTVNSWYIVTTMNKPELTWTEEKRKQVFNCNVFTVSEAYCKAPRFFAENKEGKIFSIIDTKDWAIVIPVIETPKGKQFLMVWQWRHGSQSLSLEFPGGVFNPGENAEEAAARELREETGYKAKKVKKLGEFSPNPAIMSNTVHFFLAEDLTDTGTRSLDEDEFVEVELINIEEVIKGMGRAPYVHALMGAALALYRNNTH